VLIGRGLRRADVLPGGTRLRAHLQGIGRVQLRPGRHWCCSPRSTLVGLLERGAPGCGGARADDGPSWWRWPSRSSGLRAPSARQPTVHHFCSWRRSALQFSFLEGFGENGVGRQRQRSSTYRDPGSDRSSCAGVQINQLELNGGRSPPRCMVTVLALFFQRTRIGAARWRAGRRRPRGRRLHRFGAPAQGRSGSVVWSVAGCRGDRGPGLMVGRQEAAGAVSASHSSRSRRCPCLNPWAGSSPCRAPSSAGSSSGRRPKKLGEVYWARSWLAPSRNWFAYRPGPGPFPAGAPRSGPLRREDHRARFCDPGDLSGSRDSFKTTYGADQAVLFRSPQDRVVRRDRIRGGGCFVVPTLLVASGVPGCRPC